MSHEAAARVGELLYIDGTKIPSIKTRRGVERLSETQLQAIAIRERSFTRAYAGLMRLTLGLVGVLGAACLYLVFG